MKKTIFISLLAFAAIGGLSVAPALDATAVIIKLDKKRLSGITSLELKKVSPPTFASGFAAMSSQAETSRAARGAKRLGQTAWQCLAVPITLKAKSGIKSAPHYIPEIEITIHALFYNKEQVKNVKMEDNLMRVSKTLTYVNIPLVKEERSKNLAETESLNVGFFINPSDALNITDLSKNPRDNKETNRANLSKMVKAIAIQARFKGANCKTIDKGITKLFFDKSLEKKMGKLSSTWWKSSKITENRNVTPLAISETPFAPFYASSFPATKEIYKMAASNSSDSSEKSNDDDDSSYSDDDDDSSTSRSTRSKSQKSRSENN